MSSGVLYSYLLALLLLAVSCASSRPVTVAGRAPGSASSRPWLQYTDVRQAGFDPQALQAVCERADTLKSGALMAVFRGRVILACGDVTRKFEAYSVRKSLVSGLYGTAVARREIDLNATLAQLAIDDLTPLTPTEKSATLRHVIAARSGVYVPSAYGASQERSRPARGAHAPGTHWFYNNWDFNVAGVVYERATREDLFESFDRRLAKPLGMEDWNLRDGFRAYEPTKSHHPAHSFRMSTRDLARFGQLYLQEGHWAGRQIIPAEWIRESTRPHTDDGDGTGYGYMWWTYQAGSPFTAKYPKLSKQTFYRGLGTGEQGLWVIPGEELVVVHRADTDNGRTVESTDQWELVERVLAARRTQPEGRANFGPLNPSRLTSQLPPVAIPEYRALPSSVLDVYVGEYEQSGGAAQFGPYRLTRDAPLRVFLFEGKPYLHLPGVGDAQMFPTAVRDNFTLRVAPGSVIAFERAAGEVTAVTTTFRGSTLTASKARGRASAKTPSP